jgi:MFS family permease
MWFGINKNWPRQTGPQDSMLTIAKAGFVSAKNPKIALSYAAAFVSRGNLAIVGTFFTLWLANYGTAELGMTRGEALKQAAITLAIVNISVLLGAPLIGILADRINRVTALVITLLIAAVGYGGTYFIENPFGPGMKMLAIIIGLGEVGCIIGSSTLIAQESPVRIRGAVVGFFSACGAIGILIASKVGGQLFDAWSPTGPFVLFGLFALIVALGGLALRVWGDTEPLQEAEQLDH